MSMILRRSLARALPRTRGYATEGTEAKINAWKAKQVVAEAHAAGEF